jgi:hypothetical protein
MAATGCDAGGAAADRAAGGATAATDRAAGGATAATGRDAGEAVAATMSGAVVPAAVIAVAADPSRRDADACDANNTTAANAAMASITAPAIHATVGTRRRRDSVYSVAANVSSSSPRSNQAPVASNRAMPAHEAAFVPGTAPAPLCRFRARCCGRSPGRSPIFGEHAS